MNNSGQIKVSNSTVNRGNNADVNTFVLEKNIFSNIFEKDIKRVFIYKKSERLAKAIHLITPAFRDAPSLRNRLDEIAIRLIDAAILSPFAARDVLSRELLALSSVLSIARTGGMLSNMNAELIANEAHTLLQEVATYEEPRIFLDDMPSLAELSKAASSASASVSTQHNVTNVGVPVSRLSADRSQKAKPYKGQRTSKGHLKDTSKTSSRREAVLAVIRSKGSAYIKDVSTVIRNVSEKTIQRELVAMVEDGTLIRSGERRWTSYSLAS